MIIFRRFWNWIRQTEKIQRLEADNADKTYGRLVLMDNLIKATNRLRFLDNECGPPERPFHKSHPCGRPQYDDQADYCLRPQCEINGQCPMGWK